VGGEEFLILLPDIDLHTANIVAEQVRKGVEKMKFVSSRSKRALPSVTISLSTSSYRDNEQLEHFVGRADNALIHAKFTGRNRVISETASS
jgi:diguanylate cyclase